MLKHIIDRPIGVSMALLVVAALGFVSMHFIPVSLIPNVEIPSISIQATEASFSAREMDERVVAPLRTQLIQINGLQDIVCEARDGIATIRLAFNHGSKMDYLFIEVNEKIDRAMGVLPRMERPKVVKATTSDIPVFFLNVTQASQSNQTSLSRFVREVLVKRIEQLPEVAMVDMSGTIREEILILPDERRISQAGLTISEIEQAIKAVDISLGSLTIRDGQYQYSLKFDNRPSRSEEIADIWFHCGDRLLQVKDVAQVKLIPAKRTGLVRSKGMPAVCMAIIKQSDARMGSLKQAMSDLLVQFQKDYPELSFSISRDQTELLDYSIKSLIWNIILGLFFSCLVIFLFMRDYCSPALVSLTIPIALLLSMLFFFAMGISLNIISLSGLLLGVGMMTDNSIILIDNITGRWKRGGTLRDAVLLGTREVLGPMLSSVLTTCAVFIPLIFVGGLAGALFFDEAMAVTIVLISSYIVTITAIPVFYFCWYNKHLNSSKKTFLQRVNLGRFLHKWDYLRVEWWLNHRSWAWFFVGLSVIGTFLCFTFMRKERFPQMAQTDAILHLEWKERLSIEDNERKITGLESFISKDAIDITSFIGEQQFILTHGEEQGINEAQIYFRCKDAITYESLKNRLETLLGQDSSISSWEIRQSGNLFDVAFGDNQAKLIARLRPIRQNYFQLGELRETIDEIQQALPDEYVSGISTRTDVLFTANAEKMTLYDVSYSELATLLKQALNENHLFFLMNGPQSIPVITGKDKHDLKDILTNTFIEKQGIRIPIMEVMRQGYAEDLKTLVSGEEGSYYPVEFQSLKHGADEVMSIIKRIIRGGKAFEVSFAGTVFEARRIARELLMVLILATLLLFLILSIQFESLVQPLIILSELAIDICLSLVFIWTLGISINLMSLIGLVVVCGIVINDSILKIDTINRLRSDAYPLREAVQIASRRRMKAIVMTSLTTVLAMAAFLTRGSMGEDLQFPLCLVIIIGMTVGTFVSLYLVPALYYSVYDWKGRS